MRIVFLHSNKILKIVLIRAELRGFYHKLTRLKLIQTLVISFFVTIALGFTTIRSYGQTSLNTNLVIDGDVEAWAGTAD